MCCVVFHRQDDLSSFGRMFEINRICKFTMQRILSEANTTSTGLSEDMAPCRCCQTNKRTMKYRRKTFSFGMPRVAVFLWALFSTTLLSTVSARSIQGSPSIDESTDVYRIIDNIQERDPKSLTYMKELALLLDKLKQQPLDAYQSEELLPVPMAMQGRPLQDMQEGPREDKRGSYMSLCHFKICNMGRKRNYWKTYNGP